MMSCTYADQADCVNRKRIAPIATVLDSQRALQFANHVPIFADKVFYDPRKDFSCIDGERRRAAELNVLI